MEFWNLLLAITTGTSVFIVGGSNNHCLSLSSSGVCTECLLGWYGDYCDKVCQNCDTGGCDKVTGVCRQCQAGYYSTNCSLTCPPQCRESYDDRVFCDRTAGKCLEGCKQTWWGDRCEHKCGKQCADSLCFFYDGSCAFGCEHGLTGTHCNKSCSVGCLGGNCSQLSSVCLHGCKSGFYGRTCGRRCNDKCIDEECSTQNDGDKPICSRGCVPGWKPPFCDDPCPHNCLSCTKAGMCTSCKKDLTGSSCEKRCNCRSGCSDDKLCDSCTDGWRGQTCELPCSGNCLRCQQDSGNCTTCRQGFTYDEQSQCIPMINGTITTQTRELTGNSQVTIIVSTIVPTLIIIAISVGICIIHRGCRFLAVSTKYAKDEQDSVYPDKHPNERVRYEAVCQDTVDVDVGGRSTTIQKSIQWSSLHQHQPS